MADVELQALSERLGRALSARGARLVTAESCTGGWIGEVVTMVPGSSGWYDRGFITYSNAAKRAVLGVSAQTLLAQGAVSEATVLEMVEGALRLSGAEFGLAVSGVAGPGGGTPEKPVGMVCIAVVTPVQQQVRTFQFIGPRDMVKFQSAQAAMNMLRRLLAGGPPVYRD